MTPVPRLVLAALSCACHAVPAVPASDLAVECFPPDASSVPGDDDVAEVPDLRPSSLTVSLPLEDPDCDRASGIGVPAALALVWRDGADVYEDLRSIPVAATWTRAGGRCTLHLEASLAGSMGPSGARRVTLCDAVLLTADWATFENVDATLEALAFAGAPGTSPALPLPWSSEVTGSCDGPSDPASVPRLAALSLTLSFELAGWRALHGARAPAAHIGFLVEDPG